MLEHRAEKWPPVFGKKRCSIKHLEPHARFPNQACGFSFETAVREFADPFALTEQDRIEGGEPRWRTLEAVDGYCLLLVAHTILDEDDDGLAVEIIRIISARTADRKERRRYEETSR